MTARLPLDGFRRAQELLELLGALEGLDTHGPPHPDDRWANAKVLAALGDLHPEDEVMLRAAFETAHRLSSASIRLRQRQRPSLELVRGVRLPVAPALEDDALTTVMPECMRRPFPRPPLAKAAPRRSLWRRLLGLGVLACVGCGGEVGGPAFVYGPDTATSLEGGPDPDAGALEADAGNDEPTADAAPDAATDPDAGTRNLADASEAGVDPDGQATAPDASPPNGGPPVDDGGFACTVAHETGYPACPTYLDCPAVGALTGELAQRACDVVTHGNAVGRLPGEPFCLNPIGTSCAPYDCDSPMGLLGRAICTQQFAGGPPIYCWTYAGPLAGQVTQALEQPADAGAEPSTCGWPTGFNLGGSGTWN